MAQITQEQFRKEKDIQAAVWNYRKKYYNPEATSEYWREMMEEGERLGRDLDNDYATALILICIDEFERRYRMEHKEWFAYLPDNIAEATYRRIKKTRG